MPKAIVLTGGGTAGHVMPNLALIPYLKGYFDEFHYIGSSGVEKDIVAAHPDIIFHQVPCVKLIRSLSIKNVKIPFVLMRGIAASKKLIKQISPLVIFSKGGYVALPVVKAAGNVPVICHESDISMGLANRLSAKKCQVVCTSFANSAKNFKNAVHTGAPIRNELLRGKHLGQDYGGYLEFAPNLPVLLIMGGSLGARAINSCIKESIDELTHSYNILHIAGRGNLFCCDKDAGNDKNAGIIDAQKISCRGVDFWQIKGSGAGRFYQCEFSLAIEDFFATADMVVSRGGAGAIFELMSLAKRALIIPLPKGNSRGDQVENAEYFAQRGCLHVLAQDKLTTRSLLDALEDLASDNSLIKNINKTTNINGTRKIADIIISAAKREWGF